MPVSLQSHYFSGLAEGLGLIFDMFGWAACVTGIAVSLLIAALLAIFLHTPMVGDTFILLRSYAGRLLVGCRLCQGRLLPQAPRLAGARAE